MKFAVIFDLDGTLIDTPRGIVETFSATLKSMRVKFNDEHAIRATIGLPLEQAFSGFLGVEHDDPKVAEGIKRYQVFFKELVLPKAQELIFPGVVESLVSLKTRGFALAVATSKFYMSAEALLKAANLWEYFNIVIGVDQVTKPKPHPEMGHLIMKKLGVLADEAIMIGDTTHDIMMANNAGMRSVAVTYGIHDVQKLQSSNPTWIIDKFSEIVNIVSHVQSNITRGDIIVG